MYAYIGRFHATLHDFNELLLSFANVKKEQENHSILFMTLGLYVATRDQHHLLSSIFLRQ